MTKLTPIEEHDFPIEIYNEKDIYNRMTETNFRPKFSASAYIKKGRISFIVNGKLQTCSANQMLFISNRNVYSASEISEDVELYITRSNRFSFKSPNINFNHFELFKLIVVERENAISLPENEFELIWSLLENIYTQFKQPAHKYQKDILVSLQTALIYSVIGQLESINTPLSFSQNNRKQEVTTAFFEVLFENYREERELQFYADKLHISIKYLSICIKETTDHPPTYFIAQLSLYDARILLTDKTNVIADIAETLMFSDQYAFSKFFRKNMGISPSEYRRKALESYIM